MALLGGLVSATKVLTPSEQRARGKGRRGGHNPKTKVASSHIAIDATASSHARQTRGPPSPIMLSIDCGRVGDNAVKAREEKHEQAVGVLCCIRISYRHVACSVWGCCMHGVWCSFMRAACGMWRVAVAVAVSRGRDTRAPPSLKWSVPSLRPVGIKLLPVCPSHSTIRLDNRA